MPQTMLVILAIAALLWLILAFAARMPKAGRLPVAAALALGLAGYSWQGQPGLAGAPSEKPVRMDGFGEVIDDPRQGITDRYGPPARYIALADAFQRQGNSADAARLLYGGVMRYPDSADIWVAYGDALASASEGVMTPAAIAAIERAQQLDPTHVGPPLFLGMAAAQQRDWAEARRQWQGLLDRTPAGAPWRADLESRLKMLNEAEAADSTPALPSK